MMSRVGQRGHFEVDEIHPVILEKFENYHSGTSMLVTTYVDDNFQMFVAKSLDSKSH